MDLYSYRHIEYIVIALSTYIYNIYMIIYTWKARLDTQKQFRISSERATKD